MLIVRRFYIYIICGASLGFIGVGLGNLLDLAFRRLWEAATGADLIVDASEGVRQEISLYLALVAVAVPVWALHWYLAERWSREEGERSDRGSPIRALFFMLVLGVTTVIWAFSLAELVSAGVSEILGGGGVFDERRITDSLSSLIVALGIWAFHVHVRIRDERTTVMARHAVWPVRLVVLAAAFFGLMFMAYGVSELLRWIVDVIVGQQEIVAGDRWWVGSVDTGVTSIVAGTIVWALHWGYAVHVFNGTNWRAENERASSLRRAYIYLVVLVGVAVTIGAIAVAVTAVFDVIFGVEPGLDEGELWVRVARYFATAVPFLVLWITHRRIIAHESVATGDERGFVSAWRVYAYVVAFISLAFTAVGVAWLTGTLIELGIDRANLLDTDPQWAPAQLSAFLGITLVGGAVWVWHWFRIQQVATRDPSVERAATVRRVYIYLVLTATTLAILVALAILLYQGLQLLLGARDAEGIGADVGYLIGIVLVAGGLLAYHLSILRGDMQLEAEPAEHVPEPEHPVVPHLTPAPQREVQLLLRVSTDQDVDALVADLERHLPAGANLLRRSNDMGLNVDQPAVQNPAVSSEPEHERATEDDERTDEGGRIFT